MSHKNSIEDVENLFKANNLILLDKNYKKANQKLLALNHDGFKVVISYNKLSQGRTPSVFHINNPYTIENIRLWTYINKPQYILLSNEYNGKDKKLLWFCLDCYNCFESTFNNFQKSVHPCNRCYPYKHLTEREFFERLYKYNNKYKNNKFNIESHYVNMDTSIKCSCNECNNIWFAKPRDLIYDSTGCMRCYKNNNHGKNHHNWRFDLTEEDRDKSRTTSDSSQYIWSKKVFERDNYECDILHIKCGMGFKVELNAHHLNGYHWDKENRFNIDNGVCLCKPIHKLFHKVYGSKNNTKEQYIEFKKDVLNGKYDDYEIYNKTIEYYRKEV